jgi:hypothetical protein
MTSETPVNGPKSIWQNQRREHPVMSLEEVRVKAQDVQEKVRRNLMVVFVLVALVVPLGAGMILMFSSIPMRITAGAIVLLTVTGGYSAYRRLWSRRTLSPDVALQGCVDFYRNALKAQYRSLQLTWAFLMPVLIFGFFTFRFPIPHNPRLMKIVLTAALAAIIFERRREARKINRKLEGLAAFEKELSQ